MWPRAESIRTGRLVLEPLDVAHAVEMVEVLASPTLYEWTGGEPPALADLEARYRVQSLGQSRDGTEGWLNWILRIAESGETAGYVQATLTPADEATGATEADVAWVVGVEHQGHGLACEAAQVMVSWLEDQGVLTVHALIHPGNAASAAVARRLGMSATPTMIDGEVRWTRRTHS
ncbi:GNAT family N-acetyltransferase [Marmoricola sp. URHB0036]|uniref:GNAT family N-acetyltransferase n=1 Tax=Marmoricola sp. URHB0036 TaxID=1298863 RepID=UPI0003FDEC88|nr:GNAT family N-acetyltransferase [Marmoricola sp. URHB0036]